jgi:serine/threonine protein kinase/formylglycine-generating enzyme required for sulfatase activity
MSDSTRPHSTPADPGPVADVPTLDLPTGPGDAAAVVPPAPPGYELFEEIGRGGMGVVYRGRDRVLSRDVAVKFLRPEYAPDSLPGRRFLDEARITAQLQHPGIPPVHEIGELSDGRPFLAMKLVKGRTLADLIAAGAAGRGALVAAFEQVCQAVAYAHNHGVVHRDLKPQNIMVGAFGEVQVMDWGLAKFRTATPAETPDARSASTFHDPRGGDDDLHTRAGSFLGTPAYMSPEQAIGAVDQTDERADVFGLGAVLCAVLTGHPPFVADTPEAARQMAAQKKLGPAFARLDACGAEPDLVALCKRCLTGERDERFRNAGLVAAAVAAVRAALEDRARQAELETVRVEGERQKAELRALEQQKRRRVQLALFAAVLLLVVGGGSVAWWQHRQAEAREAERRAADALSQEKERAAQREARAAALVQALGAADAAGVGQLLDALAEYRDLTGPQLHALAAQPVDTKAGLHARLALLPDEPHRADEVIAYVRACRPDEVRVLAERLRPHARKLLDAHLTLGHDAPTQARLRYACVLAAASPGEPQLRQTARDLVEWLVAANPLEAVVWADAVHPIRALLVPKLMARYPAARHRLESGRLSVSELVAEASACDIAANLLARYAHDRPAELAELAVTADPRHYPLFAPALRDNAPQVVPLLRAEFGRRALPAWAGDGEIGPALTALAGGAAAADLLDPDPRLAALAKRQAAAAATLLALGEADAAWALLRHTPDPTARSYLIERLVAIRVDPMVLVRRFWAEGDVSVKRALVLVLGEFVAADEIGAELWLPLARELLALYREHPDPGLHSAIDCALRPFYAHEPDQLARIDAELAAAARARVAARELAGVGVPAFGAAVGPLFPTPAVDRTKDWFVNGEGQTFAVVRGPVEFTLGSPATETGRSAGNEATARARIGYTFAVATKEVTNAEFRRFPPKHDYVERYSPAPDTPAVSVTWYECAAYCNWLSAREGIPEDQWCYAPNKAGEYADGMTIRPDHLSRTGYRLPTEAEWEYACRAGSAVARPFGRGEDLLPRYAWFAKNADDRTWPVGRLRPNDLGLFDVLGNAFEWVEDVGGFDRVGQTDGPNREPRPVLEGAQRLLRGGSFVYQPVDVRSAYRTNAYPPANRGCTGGFRPTRTLPR